MPFTGHAAYDPNAEVDLAVDANGEALEIDAAADLLIVTPEVTWTGQTASETL